MYEQSSINLGIKPKNLCNCVLYAESVLGLKYLGVAKDILGLSREYLRTSRLVVTSEGKYGHVAIITQVKDGLLYLKEANYYHCQESERTLPIDSPLIIGYK